jgi:ceramide glucosyltransferase
MTSSWDRRFNRSGSKVVLSRHVIEHIAINGSLRDSIRHQLRWMKSTRFSGPAGHLATVLTFAMPFGLLGLAAGFHIHHVSLGVWMFAVAYLNRVAMAIASGWNVMRDRRSIRSCWLYPLCDLMGFALWSASFWSRQIVWRGETYLLERSGRMVSACACGWPTRYPRAWSKDGVGAGMAPLPSRSKKGVHSHGEGSKDSFLSKTSQ